MLHHSKKSYIYFGAFYFRASDLSICYCCLIILVGGRALVLVLPLVTVMAGGIGSCLVCAGQEELSQQPRRKVVPLTG